MRKAAVALLAILCTCSSNSGPFTPVAHLTVATDKTSYQAGDEIHLTYRNAGNVPLEVWSCPQRLEMHQGDTWRNFGSGCMEIPPQVTSLRVGEFSEYVVAYRENGPLPGEWRVGFSVKTPDTDEVFYSNSFQLASRP
jgi:hypothetical protein